MTTADALQGLAAGALYPVLMPHAKHMDMLMSTTNKITKRLKQPLQEGQCILIY